ncbi:MAG: hypothetical protein R3341_08675 [Methylophaga sp.]|nr:hypothetical protein [Methylophaga sp.]
MATSSIKDKDYDLISAIYHAAQSDYSCKQYMEDAKKSGDDDAARFFQEVSEHNQQLINKGKALMKKRL